MTACTTCHLIPEHAQRDSSPEDALMHQSMHSVPPKHAQHATSPEDALVHQAGGRKRGQAAQRLARVGGAASRLGRRQQAAVAHGVVDELAQRVACATVEKTITRCVVLYEVCCSAQGVVDQLALRVACATVEITTITNYYLNVCCSAQGLVDELAQRVACAPVESTAKSERPRKSRARSGGPPASAVN